MNTYFLTEPLPSAHSVFVDAEKSSLPGKYDISQNG